MGAQRKRGYTSSSNFLKDQGQLKTHSRREGNPRGTRDSRKVRCRPRVVKYGGGRDKGEGASGDKKMS